MQNINIEEFQDCTGINLTGSPHPAGGGKPHPPGKLLPEQDRKLETSNSHTQRESTGV